MDFSRLVREGVYKEENLTKEEKSFVHGLRIALERLEFCAEDFADDETCIGKIKKEITAEFFEYLREDIENYINEFIVCIQDERAAAEEN